MVKGYCMHFHGFRRPPQRNLKMSQRFAKISQHVAVLTNQNTGFTTHNGNRMTTIKFLPHLFVIKPHPLREHT